MSGFAISGVEHGETLFHLIIRKLANYTSFIPLSEPFWKYVYDSHQNDPARTFMEIGLVFFALHYVFAKTYRIDSRNEIKLTEKEIDELVDEWSPEPLADPLTETEKLELESIPILSGQFGSKQKTQDGKTLLNIATFNFLDMLNSEKIKNKAIEAVRTYGVGTCGPTGFYGTLDVHLQLEKVLADFLGTEAAILYPQGFSTISSVIPCFSKRGDLIVCDDGVNFSIQKGVQISRSNVRYFKHNDMEDLERILNEVSLEDQKHPKRLVPRRFVISEGIFFNTGDVCPLPKLIRLKNKYKYRLILDESLSLGILGPNGKGAAEHFGIPPTEVDIISGSLCNSISASGGFAASTAEIVERQRLGGASYVFSASLPAALTITGLEGIRQLSEEGPELIAKLRSQIDFTQKALASVPYFQPLCGEEFRHSPVLHLRLQDQISAGLSTLEKSKTLQEIVDECMNDGVLTTRAKYHPTQELQPLQPSIRFNVSIALTPEEIEKCIGTIKTVTQRVLAKRNLI
ncbi:serine palmitoyltransferase component [Entomophthora muscae]|uniref:Serine palmitoyltransferase component n=2 Tax=Entomophthora muscae TaxID=34485 RepID=A0ACC2U0D7_9FUNG|nr:serine palmitoyltransferase component [Entomophthora muscae]